MVYGGLPDCHDFGFVVWIASGCFSLSTEGLVADCWIKLGDVSAFPGDCDSKWLPFNSRGSKFEMIPGKGKDIAVIIVGLNASAYVQQCLESLKPILLSHLKTRGPIIHPDT